MTENKLQGQSKPKKTYFLDTNVLGRDGDHIYTFATGGNKVIITDVNFEEGDRHKKGVANFNRNMRLTSINLRKLQQRSETGRLVEGALTREGGSVYLYSTKGLDPSKMLDGFYADIGEGDLRLICGAMKYKEDHPDENVTLVTLDRNLLILASENGVHAEDKRGELTDPRNLYKGYRIVKDMDFYAGMMQKFMGYASIEQDVRAAGLSELEGLATNEYVAFANQEQAKSIRVGGEKLSREQIFRYDARSGLLLPVKYKGGAILGYKPRNFEQFLTFDLLLDDNVKVKTLIGEAGTGKTFLATLFAIYKTIRKRIELVGVDKIEFPCIKVTKRRKNVQDEPDETMPGDEIDKNLKNYRGLVSNYGKIAAGNPTAVNYFEKHNIPFNMSQVLRANNPLFELLPVGDVRGESLGDYEILIIEEAQNMEPSAMKTILTRPGYGEVYITGDISQTDNTNTLEYDGLTHLVNRIHSARDPRFMSLLASLTLVQNERSPLSSWASKYL